MARKQVGDRMGELSLLAIDGNQFEINRLKGQRFVLSFLRFSSVAIFSSPLENLQKYAARHQAPFAVLADKKAVYYQ